MPKRVYIETFGCQMNVSDSEVVAAILAVNGFTLLESPEGADVVLINTCAVRDNAEQRIWGRIGHFDTPSAKRPILGILGCMAGRLKGELLNAKNPVDIVAGPDAYRRLPTLINQALGGQQAISTRPSQTETYDDIIPLRYATPGISGFTSIMRGCDNMCSYCVVPFTRGRERSRSLASILREISSLADQGYREVTLLGQNVDSYLAHDEQGNTVNFASLLAHVAEAHPAMRIRFSTSHPKDINENVVKTIKTYPNLCRHIHLPVQAGATSMLERMRRGYTREHYLGLIETIRAEIPECTITTDIIAGFCGETEEEHQATLSLMETVRFDSAFMFMYSERPGTYAARHLADDVPEEVKKQRLTEIIALQTSHALEKNQEMIGQKVEILVEGPSKKRDTELCGRTSGNKMVVFPASDATAGELRAVTINECSSATLRGTLLAEGNE